MQPEQILTRSQKPSADAGQVSEYPTTQELPGAQKIRETFCNSDDFVASSDSREVSRVIGRNTRCGSCNLPRD